jgi:nucleotidyltransferase substrate binding protein (TIGR01987 family)
MLILTPFTHALKSLEDVLLVPKTSIVRDSAIQRFEYTYELAIKMLRRSLEQHEASTAVIDELAFKDLIRVGAEKGYIENPRAWFSYRDSRNITSHAYDEKKAESIYAVLPNFVEDARALHTKLEEKNV